MFFVLSEALAQHYNVYIFDDKGKPLKGVTVYSFISRETAKDAFEAAKLEYGIFDTQKYKPISVKKTDSNGFCIIQCSPSGSLLLDGYHLNNFELQLEELQDYDISDNQIELKFRPKGTKSKIGGDLMELPVIDKLPPIKEGGGLDRNGDTITIEKEITISGENVRKDARFVAFPIITFLEKLPVNSPRTMVVNKIYAKVGDRVEIGNLLLSDLSGDTIRSEANGIVGEILCHEGDTVKKDSALVMLDSAFIHMAPAVIDGKDYARSMVRRMSFDVFRDKLNEYRFDAGLYLENHQSEYILYKEKTKIKKGSKYYVPGVIWYEDYNGVYSEDSLLFSDGKERNPMRFLNWDEVRTLSPIDATLFEHEGTISSVPDARGFHLNFEQGNDNLNLRDSITLRERERMIDWLQGYYNESNSSYIEKIVVKAYSSPEGGEKVNRGYSQRRANNIQKLLQNLFPRIKGSIVLDFDDYGNVVPWNIVADTMLAMGDTLSHRYANEIKKITTDIQNFDAQYKEIYYKRHYLRDYLEKYVLDRVRLVSIEAHIVEEKILSKEQVLEKYNSDPDRNLPPYQYYTLIRHFAEEEQWDELYKISKRAYEANDPKIIKYVDNKRVYDPVKKETVWAEARLPYPLAGYYYAISSIRKGLVDTEILTPYFDEGPIGTRDSEGLNSLPFIVAQVLMYCQCEDFHNANKLIKKYKLMDRPHLKGLVMFVRCLNGDYNNDTEVSNYVMNTSPMNKAVVLSALKRYKEALVILNNEETLSQPNAKVEYLRAICLFQSQLSTLTSLETESLPKTALYNTDPDDKYAAWAVPMLNAFALDETNLDYIEEDGYFNNAYRQMVLYAWKRMQAGVSLEEIADEYQVLVNKMNAQKNR